jgi:hypothetical protein
MSLDVMAEETSRSPYSTFRNFAVGKSEAANCPIVTYVRMEAGDPAPRHAHGCWTINIVIEGSARLADFPDVELKSGHVLTCEPNLQYGPLIAGEKGVTLFEIFGSADGRPPVWDDPSDPVCIAYEKWLKEQGYM